MFSRTDSRENRPRPSGTTAIPCRRTRVCVLSSSACLPLTSIEPAVRIRPRIARMVVVLPAPFAPTRARQRPWPSVRVTSKRACVFPYQARSPWSSSTVADSEIGFLDAVVLQDQVWRAGCDQRPRVHRDGEATELSDDIDVVLDDDHRERLTRVQLPERPADQ